LKREQGGWCNCFEIRIPRKKDKVLLLKVPSKIYGSNFIMEKNNSLSIIPNIIIKKWDYSKYLFLSPLNKVIK
jgi:hypothetical protein